MAPVLTDPDALVALGAFTGALVLVVCLSAVLANTYRERALLVHAAAVVMGVLAVQTLFAGQTHLAETAMLLVLGLSGAQLRSLVSHAGALRQPRRWLMAVSLGLLPVLAALSAAFGWQLLLAGLAAWVAVVLVLMLRAWPQSQPWASWLLPGQVALSSAALCLGWANLEGQRDALLPMAGLLAVWAFAVHIATVWRSRLFSETRVRIDARNLIDPLTRLSMPLVFAQRLEAVRSLIKRYGHPSVVLLVSIENLPRLAAEFGLEVAESALVTAADRIRESLGDGDVAARLSHARFAVLAEGRTLAEGSSIVASRILVAGLREPLAAAPSEFLQFRIVLASVPTADIAAKAILQRLGARMDQQLVELSERRIAALTVEELLA